MLLVAQPLKVYPVRVGFVEDSAYPYAFVVVVENGGWGSSVAGGVAASLLKAACQ